jgi:hypothetical protein
MEVLMTRLNWEKENERKRSKMGVTEFNIIEEEPPGISRKRKKSRGHKQSPNLQPKINPKGKIVGRSNQIRDVHKRLISLVTCSVCNAKVKKERLPKHFSKVHGVSNPADVSGNNRRVTEDKKPQIKRPLLGHLTRVHPDKLLQSDTRRRLIISSRPLRPDLQPDISVRSRKMLIDIEKLLERNTWLYPSQIGILKSLQRRLLFGKSIERKHKAQLEKIRQFINNRLKPRFWQGGRVSGH